MTNKVSHSHEIFVDGTRHWVNHRHDVDIEQLAHAHKFEAGLGTRANMQQIEQVRRRNKRGAG